MKTIKPDDKIVAAILVLGLLIIACSQSFIATTPTATEEPSPKGSIIFVSDETGNFELYQMDIETRERTKLTDNTSDESTPFYFPPARIGYVSDKTGKYQIYTMAMDGSDQETWKKDKDHALFTPSVSPNGKQVVHVVQISEDNSVFYLTDPDGDDEQELEIDGMVWDPSWSPDGDKIAMSFNSGGDWEVAVYDLDTERLERLTQNSAYDGRPRWSPDGDQLLFDSDRDGDWEIYVMDADGDNVKSITENASGDWAATWSPDGQWIVYTSNRDGDDDLYIVDADGLHQTRLTDNSARDQFPVWLPQDIPQEK